MPEQVTISKTNKLLPSQDYQLLRKAGLNHIEKLSHKIWTDYNVHDPGITILELLCYTTTDLGYRTAFETRDILASDPQSAESEPDQFFTAAQIFPCNPITLTDFRKLLVDLKGVKNAWLEISDKNEVPVYVDAENNTLTYVKDSGNEAVQLNGLYNILIELEDGDETDATSVFKRVIDCYHAHRNLCEDYYSIDTIEYEDIAVCADIEVTPDADMDEILAQIYHNLCRYFSPQINFYTIEELLTRGKTIDEIFEGPLLDHGFIDSDELAQADLRRQLRGSDIINFIMDIPGVVAVKNLLLTSYRGGVPKQIDKTWILDLSDDNSVARLDIEKSKFVFYKDILPYIADKDKATRGLAELNQLNRKYKLQGHQKDLPIPQGEFMDIEDYYPVQNEFPLVYGIGEVGLPQSASAERKAQAKQLKAYLLFFEQLLANYLSQLANVRHLFAYDDSVAQTYFVQELSEIKKLDELFLDYSQFTSDHYGIAENQALYEKRRNRFLNHLMGRFCEEITEYSLLMYALLGKEAPPKLIKDKIAFLSDYPQISSERSKAFDYKNAAELWDSDNVAGMIKRVSRLLGFENIQRRHLACRNLIVEKTGDNYIIKLLDPEDTEKTVLTSIAYPDEECAEGILHYILSHGDNRDNYVSTSDGAGKFYFNFKNDCDEVIAVSQAFNTAAERNDELLRVIDFFKQNCDIEGLYVVEHILLRPKTKAYQLLPVCVRKPEEETQDGIDAPKSQAGVSTSCPDEDPYSFRISVILPSWPEKFRDVNFRRFVEKTIRMETPAHIFPRICYVDLKQMIAFEDAYKPWLEEIAAKKQPDKEVVNKLIAVLFNLKNVYPVAKLHDCEYAPGEDPQVILDYSTLGII
jgi:hypothetical protein